MMISAAAAADHQEPAARPHVDPPNMSKADKRKLHKPLMEKRRRDRINGSLSRLKSLVLSGPPGQAGTPGPPGPPGLGGVTGESKLEKADILEMAVSHLTHLTHRADTVERAAYERYRSGFTYCLGLVTQYLCTDIHSTLVDHLISHMPSPPTHTPHHEYSAPHDDYSPPHDDYSPPHDDYSPPHDDYSPPHYDYSAPHHEYPSPHIAGYDSDGDRPEMDDEPLPKRRWRRQQDTRSAAAHDSQLPPLTHQQQVRAGLTLLSSPVAADSGRSWPVAADSGRSWPVAAVSPSGGSCSGMSGVSGGSSVMSPAAASSSGGSERMWRPW